MSDITGISSASAGPVGRAEPLSRPHRPVEVPVRRDSDRVEVSREAREARETAKAETIRRDLVTRVKQEIQAGTYDSDEKANLAADIVIARLNKSRTT